MEGDWSAASYWYELAAVAAHYGYEIDICLHGMRKDSRQGDRVVAQLFEELGVKTTYTKEGARLVASPNPSQGRELSVAMPAAPLLGRGGGEALDFTHCPDIAQTMAVTYCLLDIPFIFTGIQSLRIKETDRVAALISELKKLGFVLRAEGDE